MFFDLPLFGNNEIDILIKLLLAAIADGLIGLEREKHGRPAGLRTNILVSLGACAMMIISEAFYLKYGMLDTESEVRFDPSRVAAQIVTGIGFLYSQNKREVWSRGVWHLCQLKIHETKVRKGLHGIVCA